MMTPVRFGRDLVRHAHATELRVKLEQVDGHLTLTVVDDGRGFDRAAVDTSAHFGLKGMQERADLAGGQLLDAEGRAARVLPLGARRPEAQAVIIAVRRGLLTFE